MVEQQTPNGMYYSEKAPFLSTAAAVCAGARSERSKFSTGDAEFFCRESYGLTADQTAILLAASANAPGPDFSCAPTPSQLRAIIAELEAELARDPRARVRPDLSECPPKPFPPPPLDPYLSRLFSVLIALYSHYILGQGPEPVGWQAALLNELTPDVLWWVW